MTELQVGIKMMKNGAIPHSQLTLAQLRLNGGEQLQPLKAPTSGALRSDGRQKSHVCREKRGGRRPLERGERRIHP